MREVSYPGSMPATVTDIAAGEVRMPDDDYGDNRFRDLPHDTLTLAEYWEARNSPPKQQTPCRRSDDDVDTYEAAPFDDYTVDAEVIIGRLSSHDFTTVVVGQLIGILPSAVLARIRTGDLPRPAIPATAANGPNRWSTEQVIEIVADHLRREEATPTSELADLLCISPRTVRRWIESGRLPQPRYGGHNGGNGIGGEYRWSVDQVAAILRSEKPA